MGITLEHIHVVDGGKPTSINTPFYGARFVDTINKSLQSGWTFYQQFSVSVTGLNATPGFVPIAVREMDGKDYGTLGIHVDEKGTVFINGNDGKDKKGVPRPCP